MAGWDVILSFFWKGSLGIALIALAVLFVYLCRTLGSLRNSLNSIQNTLNSTENLVNQEVGILINDVSQTVKEINKELPQLLQNINGVTASIQQISENEVQPTLHSVQELTETLNQSVQELEAVVQKVSTFSGQTIEQAEYFRNQVAVSLADIVSMWHGLKAGWERLYKSSHSSGTAQSNAEDNESQPTVESLQNDESETETSTEQSEVVAE
ncbi:MAG: DUF948 domain-containing protein [Candidatus Poribacteria bacterium]|nr:DUF948 domain-containing protein [Candidatus Poribacteria bacterium]